VFFIANATGQILTGLGRAIDSVQTATGSATEGSREQTKELQALGQSISSLDLVGFSEHLGQSWGLLKDGAKATNELADANERWRQKLEGAVGALTRAMAIQREIEQDREKRIASMKDEEAAISRIAATELQNGKLTKETSDRVAELLSQYEKMGIDPPERLKALADAHGILSDKAKESAESVKQLAGQLEGNAEALKKRDEELIKAIALIEKDGIVTKETAKSVSSALDEQLAGYAKLGVEPPKVVADLASKYKDLAGAAADSGAGMAKVNEELDTLRKSLDEALARYNEIAGSSDANAASISKLKAEISDLSNKNLTNPEEIDRLDTLKKKLFELTTAQGDKTKATEQAEKEDAAYNEVLAVREQLSRKETEALNQQLAASEKRRQEIAASSVAEGELTVTMENGTQAIAGRGVVITNLSEEARKGGVHFDELTRTLVNTEKPLELVAKTGAETAASLSDISKEGPAANEVLEKAANSVSSMRADFEWMKQNLPELATLLSSTFNGTNWQA
jgi:chromosome segregation ATPase